MSSQGYQRSWSDIVPTGSGREPRPDDGILSRVSGEYREMPGLSLTPVQAARMWQMDAQACEAILCALVEQGVLRRRSDGAFVRSDE